MRHLLGPTGKAQLRGLLEARTLLAFDYDGTLAPLRRRTIEAWLPPETQTLWTALCLRYPCAVVSGRGLADLKRRMAGAGPCTLVGNHGMEPEGKLSSRAPHWSRQVKQWGRQLRVGLRTFRGVLIESKRWSISIHWRGAPDAQGLTRRVRAMAEGLEGARLIGGKKVLNVVPVDAPNKGDAVRQAMQRRKCSRALFVGDDVTDEDGFALARLLPVMGVRVGRASRTQARFSLRDQSEVNELLHWLLRGP